MKKMGKFGSSPIFEHRNGNGKIANWKMAQFLKL